MAGNTAQKTEILHKLQSRTLFSLSSVQQNVHQAKNEIHCLTLNIAEKIPKNKSKCHVIIKSNSLI